VSEVSYSDIYEAWRSAPAFLVDHMVCGDFSIPSAEDLADAEAADEDDRFAEYEPYVAFYVYGERGLKREYFVDRKMIENGESYADGLRVVYCDGKALTIEPLFRAEELSAKAKAVT
jgi:hypothetical protein